MVDIEESKKEIIKSLNMMEYEMNKDILKICYEFNKNNNDFNYNEFDKNSLEFANKINEKFVQLDCNLWKIKVKINEYLP